MNRNRNEYDSERKRGLYVEVRNNDVGRAMRKLKKLCNNEGMIKDMRKNEFYEKPSAKRRRQRNSVKHRKKYSNKD